MKGKFFMALALFFVFSLSLGFGVACAPDASSSAQEVLTIEGRPNGDLAILSDTENTLTLVCGESNAVWTSSDTAVATVQNGKVTLLSAGSTVIRAQKGNKTGEFILTVVDERTPAPVRVTVENAPEEALLSIGSLQLNATCSDGSEVVWFSRNEAVATVDATGKVTLLQRGSVEIVAQKKGDASVYTVCALKVLAEPVTALTAVLGLDETGTVKALKAVQLSLATTPADCEPFETEWSVEDDTVAAVSPTGELLGLKAGVTTVTARVKGTEISISKQITVLEGNTNFEDFSSAVVIGNYIVGATEIRDASNALSPRIVYDEEEDNYYLKYSHAKANGNNKYMIYRFTGLETGARYVLKYNMKVLSHEGAYNHQINLYSDIDIPVAMNDPLVGNVYDWHTTGLDTAEAKIYQSGSGALYRDGVRWKDSDDSTDAFHEYTLGFIAGESTVGFAFVCNNTYTALFDYICVEKAPEVEAYTLSTTARLPVGESYAVKATAVSTELIYYQPFKFDWSSSDESVATVDENGRITAVKAGEVIVRATDKAGQTVEMPIQIVPALTDSEKRAYDIFYEETNEQVTNTYLNLKYALPEEQKITGAKLYDSYELALEIDAIYYAGEVQMYIGFEKADGTLIGQRFWTNESFPASGEKKVEKFVLQLGWPDKGADNISTLQIYLRYGTDYQIGINVLSIEKYEPQMPDASDFDIWLQGSGWTDATAEISPALTGLSKGDTFTITFTVTIVSGTVDFLYFDLYNASGMTAADCVSNSYGVNGNTDGRLREIASYSNGTHTVSYTATLKWTQASGSDVSRIVVKACSEDGTTPVAYAVGVKVSVTKNN